ncbi:sialidase family protein [uncultured Muribaculum sp.]|uniref:sialidase family protein n=1 Tax=uncultured Muribaculum sp. TaxID=1918613 RepID=UPI0025D22FDB|nr:sialidase family protein [uncultured Muribaculum sp.]
MNACQKIVSVALCALLTGITSGAARPKVTVAPLVAPVLSGLDHSPAERITVIVSDTPVTLDGLTIDFGGSTDIADILSVGLYGVDDAASFSRDSCIGSIDTNGRSKVTLPLDTKLAADISHMWLGITLRDSIDLSHRIVAKVTGVTTDKGHARISAYAPATHRTGVALHSPGQDGIASCRIPGIATAPDGTLLAIYDARYDSKRDLQGDIDIALRRSTDGGATWLPMQTVLDMGTWGGLPERYNGVSDACILVDPATGRIFVAGLWMHGVLDENGRWIEGIDDKSTYWIHQWKARGSQPGTGIRQTCQFLISHSDDNGLTWSFPDNITSHTKRPEWWLYAPAPGQGTALSDGTLVLPTQGRDSNGLPFSNITWSTDHGRTWTASNPAYDDVTECNAVQLSDGSVMLNMRDNRNRGHREPNGRRVCVTSDLGATWREHPGSRRDLTEPTCMASLYRHRYTGADGRDASILLFANPAHHKVRKNLTLKASLDDGLTWPEEHHILFDETRGMGYSSITSVGEDAVGILYESGLADLVFIRIDLDEILNNHNNTSK